MDQMCPIVVEKTGRITVTEWLDPTDGHTYTQGSFIPKYFTIKMGPGSKAHRKRQEIPH